VARTLVPAASTIVSTLWGSGNVSKLTDDTTYFEARGQRAPAVHGGGEAPSAGTSARAAGTSARATRL